MDYTTLASQETILKTIQALKGRGIEALTVTTKEEALEKVKSLIPKGASVNNGASITLEQIGLVEYLKGNTHGWHNLHAAVLDEKNPEKQAEARKLSSFADYYLGSVHAIAESGEIVLASASGSQMPSLTNTAKNIILVVSTQKIMPTLELAIKRLREHVVPLEDQHMKDMGAPGTVLAKILIIEQEPAFMGRTVRVIFVSEKLGL